MPLTLDISEPQSASREDQSLRENTGGLAEIAEFYRQIGYESGYARAAADQMEYAVAVAEQILREQGDSVRGPRDARRLLYAFIARADRRLSLFATLAPNNPDEGYMEGGSGI